MQAQDKAMMQEVQAPVSTATLVTGNNKDGVPAAQQASQIQQQSLSKSATTTRPGLDALQDPASGTHAVGLDGRPITITRYVPPNASRPSGMAGPQPVETTLSTKRSHESMSAGQQRDVVHGSAGRIVTTSVGDGQVSSAGHPIRSTLSADRARATSPAVTSVRQVLHPGTQARPVHSHPGHAVQIIDGVAYPVAHQQRTPPGTVVAYGPPPPVHAQHMYAPGPPVATRVVARPMMQPPPGSHMHPAGYAPAPFPRPYGVYTPHPVQMHEPVYAEPPHHYHHQVITRPAAYAAHQAFTHPYGYNDGMAVHAEQPQQQVHVQNGPAGMHSQVHDGANEAGMDAAPAVEDDERDNNRPAENHLLQQGNLDGAGLDAHFDDQRTETLPDELPRQQQQQDKIKVEVATEGIAADARQEVITQPEGPSHPYPAAQHPGDAAAEPAADGENHDHTNKPGQDVKQEEDVKQSQGTVDASVRDGGIERRPSHQASSGMARVQEPQGQPAVASSAAIKSGHHQQHIPQSDGQRHVDRSGSDAAVGNQQVGNAMPSMTRSAERTVNVGAEGQQSAQPAQQLAPRHSQVHAQHRQHGQEANESSHTTLRLADEAHRMNPHNAQHRGQNPVPQGADPRSVEYGTAHEPGAAYAAQHELPPHGETINRVMEQGVSPREGGAYEVVEYDTQEGHAGAARNTAEELVTPNYAVAGGPAIHPLQYPGHSRPQGVRYTPQPPHAQPPAAVAIPKTRPQQQQGYVQVPAQEALPMQATRPGYAPAASHMRSMPQPGTIPAAGPPHRAGQTMVYEESPAAQYAYPVNTPPPSGAIPVAPPQYCPHVEAQRAPYPATHYVTTAIDPVTGQEVQYIYEDAPPPDSVTYVEDPSMAHTVVYEAPSPAAAAAPSHAPQQPVAMYEQKRLILEDGQEVIVYEPIEAPPPGAVVYETWPEEQQQQQPHARHPVMYEPAPMPVMQAAPPRHRPGLGYGAPPSAGGPTRPPPVYYQPPPQPAGGHPPHGAPYAYGPPPPGPVAGPPSAGKPYPYRPPAQYDYPPPHPSYSHPQPQTQPAGNAAQDDQKYGYLRRPKRIRPDQVCAACGSRSTPQWRTGDNNEMLCNACGLRFRKVKQVKDGRQTGAAAGQGDGSKPNLDVPPY